MTFKQIYESVPYAAVTSIIDMAIVFIPIYKLDTFNSSEGSKDMYLMSELLNSYVFAEAFMLSISYSNSPLINPKNRRKTQGKIVHDKAAVLNRNFRVCKLFAIHLL
jgi:hypothetical protein